MAIAPAMKAANGFLRVLILVLVCPLVALAFVYAKTLPKAFKSDEFVESDDDGMVKAEDTAYGSDDDEEDVKPKKKAKKETKQKESKIKNEPESSTNAAATSSDAQGLETNAEGDKYLNLGKLKRATVRTFKKHVLIDLREYYVDKDSGDQKPGKKGLSLSPDQWKALKESMALIDAEVSRLGG